MDLINIRQLFRESEKFDGQEITVGGWVKNNRASKNFGFLVISDGTFFEPLQIVYGEELSNFAELSKLNVGTAVIVRGKIVLTPDAKQKLEMQAIEAQVEGNNPSRILSLGFAIVRSAGKALTDTDHLEVGQNVEITLADGTVSATITEVKK